MASPLAPSSVQAEPFPPIGLAGPFKPIGLAGPTASGKTGIALMLADHFPLEIISVDSALVYQGMDVGTAKPSKAELASVPHHLIDIIDPTCSYSAAQFVQDATAAVLDIQRRGKLPLLVGGTMLYFKALIDGLDDMPPVDPSLRPHIEQEAARIGWPALHEQLRQFDPITAARLNPNDAQRISRALEVYLTCGQPLSAFQKQRHVAKRLADADDTDAANPTHHVNKIHIKTIANTDFSPIQNASNWPLGAPDMPEAHLAGFATAPKDVNFFHNAAALQDLLVDSAPTQSTSTAPTPSVPTIDFGQMPLISLEPSDRAWLHQRIGQRFAQMLQDGLVAEVQALRQRGDLQLEMPSMRCVGYRQTWQLLDEGVDLQSPAGQQRLIELGSAATRQLAKRQLTWLRSMPNRHIVPCDTTDVGERVLALVRSSLPCH